MSPLEADSPRGMQEVSQIGVHGGPRLQSLYPGSLHVGAAPGPIVQPPWLLAPDFAPWMGDAKLPSAGIWSLHLGLGQRGAAELTSWRPRSPQQLASPISCVDNLYLSLNPPSKKGAVAASSADEDTEALPGELHTSIHSREWSSQDTARLWPPYLSVCFLRDLVFRRANAEP